MALLEADLDHRLPPGKPDAKGEWVCDECPGCGGKKKLYFNPRLAMGVCFKCGVRLHGWGDLEDLYDGRLEALAFMAVGFGYSGGGGRCLSGPVGDPWKTSRGFFDRRGITEVAVRAVPLGLRGTNLTAVIDPLSREYSPETYIRNADGSGKWIPARDGVERQKYAFGWRATQKDHDGREVVLLEGIMDLLAHGLMGRALSIMGTDFPEPLAVEMGKEGMRAALLFDPDQPGDKARKAGMQLLRGWGVPCRILPTKKDPKDMTTEELQALLRV